MAISCAGCGQEIKDRLFLKCSNCNTNYDLECANVPEKRFFNTMTKEHKCSWKCPLCRSKMPKIDNTNSPVQQYHHKDQPLQQKYEGNVTFRKNKYEQHSLSLSNDDDSISCQGDTLLPDSPQLQTAHYVSHDNDAPQSQKGEADEKITLEKFIIILQHNNDDIIKKMTNLLQEQINSVVTKWEEDFKKYSQTISIEQSKIKDNIAVLDSRITSLSEKCSELKAENENMQRQINKLLASEATPDIHEANEKTLVLHGLQEQYWEREEELENRIINTFHDILNINLTGYIEEITYIGNKKTYRRPIKIELISKKMRKFILENSIYFKEVGLSITECLNKSALQERKNLKQALYDARKLGHFAVIKNGKLIVDPKNTKEKIHPEKNHHNDKSLRINNLNNCSFRDGFLHSVPKHAEYL